MKLEENFFPESVYLYVNLGNLKTNFFAAVAVIKLAAASPPSQRSVGKRCYPLICRLSGLTLVKTSFVCPKRPRNHHLNDDNIFLL